MSNICDGSSSIYNHQYNHNNCYSNKWTTPEYVYDECNQVYHCQVMQTRNYTCPLTFYTSKY